MDPNKSHRSSVWISLGVIGVFCFSVHYCDKVNNPPEWKPYPHPSQEEANLAWQKELNAPRAKKDTLLESYEETYNRILREQELKKLEPYIQTQVEIHQSEADIFQDRLDEFYDDMEDEIRFPPEVFDANLD